MMTTLLWICVLVLVIRLTQRWVADICLVLTSSMENTILAGDRILVCKTHVFGRGDVIVFNHPNGDNVQLVKRCIGTPGDTVSIIKGMIYVNGKIVEVPVTVKESREDFPLDFPDRRLGWTTNHYGPVIVPAKGATITLDSVSLKLYRQVFQLEGHESPQVNSSYIFSTDGYFVLGDNRGNSLDSRYWGFVPGELVVGKVRMVYFSRDAVRRSIRWERIGLMIQ